jgi:hypothetical protein
VNPRHNACAAAKEFSRNVMGDARILRRELQNDPESRIALEETARFLGQLSQEMNYETWPAGSPSLSATAPMLMLCKHPVKAAGPRTCVVMAFRRRIARI